MTLTFGDVRNWRAAPLGAAGDGLKKDVRVLEESRDTLETAAVPGSWSGLSRFFAQVGRDALVRQMSTHIGDKRRVQRALYDAETQVAEVERLVLDAEGQARAQGFTIGSDGSVTDTSTPPTFESRWEAEEWSRGRRNQAQAIADDITRALAEAAAADATIAGSMPAGEVQAIDEYGTPDPEVAARWAELTDPERRAVVEEMIEEQAAESGVQMPTTEWKPESWGPNGQWSDEDPPIVRLNERQLDDPQILHTVGHEVRHGRQFEAIRDYDDWQFPWEEDPFDEHQDDGITEQQVETWDENFDDYQSTSNGDSYEEYFTQPVEEDARDSGREHLEGMTEEELERLLEESR